ncbi:MAG: GGDEF domain-containing protein [Lachnospiraceae bacterium]|nr:GGDEF domain-containing protein [Lachnospiraceae bacterium]
MKRKRRNIALLVSGFENIFVRQLCIGAMSAAVETDCNLVIFLGRFYNPPYYDQNIIQYDYQFNTVFDYAKKTDFDAFLIELNTIGMYLDLDQKKEFLRSFGDVPIILLTCQIEGYSSIRFDNREGFAEGIRHLIKDHHCKKIGFMAGTVGNEDSIERYEVYRSVLEEFGMEADPSMVQHGNFTEYCEDQVNRLLDDHPDMDALVFANDGMALGGYRVFKKRGLKIGSDIHVMGFDDAVGAISCEPNLTTVRADAAGLGYRAVKNVEDFLSRKVTNLKIPSLFVRRQSCGCTDIDYSVLPLTVEDIKDRSRHEKAMEKVYDYIFSGNDYEKGAATLKELLNEFMDCACESMGEDAVKSENALKKLVSLAAGLCRTKLEPYTRIEKVTFLFECLCRQMKKQSDDEHRMRVLSETFQQIYRNTASFSQKNADNMLEKVNQLNSVTTTFLRDVLNYAVADDVLFSSMIETLAGFGFDGTYLLRLPSNQTVKKAERAAICETMMLKACQRKGTSCTPNKDSQKREVKDLFINLFADREEQVCAVASMLFSGLEQYGLMVFEVDETNIYYITTGIYQTSAAIKTIELLKNREDNEKKLKKSLKKLGEANAMLDELSKSDELTQLLNRRGFLMAVHEEIEKPENEGKRGVIIFADMNNLKIVNDRFGHEDGDFSLRMVADILKKSTEEFNPIVARFGGDEFCAFYVDEGGSGSEELIRSRVKDETEKLNSKTAKPYYVSMSMGFCSFSCNGDVNLADMIDRADTGLYDDKKNKRESVYK